MKKRFNLKIHSILSIALVNLLGFSMAFTAAAFLRYEVHSQNINIDLGYGQYFGSKTQDKPATGTKEDPYVISNGAHLRNLSYLVNLGLFGPNDYFEVISSGFTYTGDPLMPIGSDQNPFMSHFVGQVLDPVNYPEVVPVISNLQVEGDNLPDVGMFGYISNSAEVGNFILDNPIIRSYETLESNSYCPANEGYDFHNIDDNPLSDIKLTSAVNEELFSVENCEKITLTTTDNTSVNKVMDNFQINVTEIQNLITAEGYSFNLYPIISDENLIIQNSKDKWSFSTKQGATIPLKPNSTQEVEGKYCTVSIAVSGIVPFGDSYRYSTMILERYKLFFNYDKDLAKEGIVVDENDFKTYGKMKYPEPFYTETTIVNEEDNTTKSGYIKYDEIRSLYVGVIAGQTDGNCHHIGVKSPKLDIQRPFISNSILFGKTIDDTNKRTLSHEEFTTSDALINNNNLSFKWVEDRLIDIYKKNGKTFYDPDHGFGNNYVSDIYDLDSKNNPKVAMSRSAQNIIRIYGDNQLSNNEKLPPVGKGITGNMDKIKYSDGTTTDMPAISMSKPMDVKLHESIYGYNDASVLKNGYKNILASNALQLWVSAQHTKSRVNDWFNGSVEFYLDVEISYLYFDDLDNPKTIKTASGEVKDAYNVLTIFAGEKALRGQSLYKRQKGHHYALPRTRTPTYPGTDDVPFEPLGDAIYYKKNDIEIGKPNNNNSNYNVYPFAWIENVSKDVVGQDGQVTTQELSGFEALKLKKSDSLKNLSTNTTGYPIQTMKFSIAANKEFRGNLPGRQSRITKGFFPVFYIGLPNRSETQACRFDILGMDITLSNKRGNIDSSTGTVDYINGTTLPLRGNRKTLWNGTGVKVYAQTIVNVEEDRAQPSIPIQHFAHISNEVNVNTSNHYYISLSRNPNSTLLTVTYNPYNLKTVSEIAVGDTPGFKLSNPQIDNTLIF